MRYGWRVTWCCVQAGPGGRGAEVDPGCSRGGSGCSRGGTGDPGNEMMVAAGGRRALMNVQQESPRGGGGL